MDSVALQPILAGLVRHGLTSLGGALVAGGYMDSSETAAFVGGGMVVAGVVWSWWQKRGQAKVLAIIAKMHPVAPPSATTTQAVKAATDAAKAVASILLVAFALSFLLGSSSAQAQTRRQPVDPLSQLVDKAKADFTKKTGVPATGDVPFDLLRALDAKLLPDLTYAKKLADATGSKVTSTCYGAWIDMINVQQTAVQTKNADGTTTDLATPDPHLITDFERAVELRNALQPDSPFMVACSPVANMIKQDVVQFMAAVVAGNVSLATLVPGL